MALAVLLRQQALTPRSKIAGHRPRSLQLNESARSWGPAPIGHASESHRWGREAIAFATAISRTGLGSDQSVWLSVCRPHLCARTVGGGLIRRSGDLGAGPRETRRARSPCRHRLQHAPWPACPHFPLLPSTRLPSPNVHRRGRLASTGRNRLGVACRGACWPRKKQAKLELPTRSTLSRPNSLAARSPQDAR